MPDKVLKITSMKTYKNYLDNFKRLAEYTIHKSDGNTVEMNVDNADTKGWKFIGEIVYGGPDWHKNDRKYILCYPDYTEEIINSLGFSSFISSYLSVNADANGSDGGKYFYSLFDSRFDKIKLNDEYKNGIFALIFKKYLVDDGDEATQNYREQKHQEFMNKLFQVGDNVIMHHNSSAKITDGVIKPGMPKNSYSNNNDWGVYFWASPNSGADQSGAGEYTYYCIVPIEQTYDVENNIENFKTDKEALAKYPYQLKDWKNGQAIACQTSKPTPIWRIRDNHNGKWFDNEWNEVNKPNVLN